MNRSNNNELSAGTEADSNSKAKNQQVSQPNANTNVVGSLFSQREIKFRAWDYFNDVMIYDHDDETDFKFYGGKPLIKYVTEQHTVENGIDIDRPIWNQVDGPVMQYTGLKDKNGKEIYEGDIVKANGSKTILVKDHSETRRFVSPIFKDEYKSEEGRFLFLVYWQSCFSQFDFKSLDSMISINCEVNKREFEVIGNVFENPELLETLR